MITNQCEVQLLQPSAETDFGGYGRVCECILYIYRIPLGG